MNHISNDTVEKVYKFRDDRDWKQFHNPKDLAISISLEAAELLETFQWSGSDCYAAKKKGKNQGRTCRCSHIFDIDGGSL